MAKAITKRTLIGYSGDTINSHYFDDLINVMQNKPQQFIGKVLKQSYWKKGNGKMQFDAIVGNPPYQQMDGGNRNSSSPVYQFFVTQAKKIESNYISMITPSRWFAGGKGLDDFRSEMLNDKRIIKIIDYFDSNECFKGVDIAGGVNYFLWNKNHQGDCEFISVRGNIRDSMSRKLNDYDILIRNNASVALLQRICSVPEDKMDKVVGTRNTFGISTDEHGVKNKDSFSEGYIEVFATDVGDWSLELTNTEGKIFKFRGSLCSEFEVQGEDLSELIRDSLGMPELYVFDGNYKPDIVNRIEVDYHRITQIMPKQSAVELDRVVWNYTESLVIDRNQESIEQIQNIGTGCSVSRKYMVEDGIDSLLDDLDVDVLFGHIEGNPVDVVDDPNEIRDYTIKVITKKGKEKIIRGTYDKKGLPDGWEVFIDSVFEFMAFYGWGEIMDPSVYGRIRRCRSDIIFCSVTFEEGYKRYYYIADDDSIEVGDFVIVPAGKDNHEAVVEVVKKEYFSENEVPLPLDRTKHIIRKCTESDLNLPE